jgi:hypothetical protein
MALCAFHSGESINGSPGFHLDPVLLIDSYCPMNSQRRWHSIIPFRSGGEPQATRCIAPPHASGRSAIVVFAALVCLLALRPAVLVAAEPAPSNARRPANDGELQYWLESMVRHHRFTIAEVTEATGMSTNEVAAALSRFDIVGGRRPLRPPVAPPLVLPYPGGRHPRIGFLDGAIRPQRETKISVFTPWDRTSYVVVDVPEAIWSNLGLTYLAHTHIPTVFDRRGIKLPPLEWNRRADGTLELERRLPNGIAFGTTIVPETNRVKMELWLTNGTDQPLSDLRVQTCVMLKAAAGFNAQTNANKIFSKPYVACKSDEGTRWVITAWDPCDRAWGNPPVPCLHSDPKFPDCAPGETKRLRGWLSFYEGTNIHAEFQRIEQTGWRK